MAAWSAPNRDNRGAVTRELEAAAPAPARTLDQAPAQPSLLDLVLQATEVVEARRPEAAPALEQFLRERSPEAALAFWLSRSPVPRGGWSNKDVLRLLNRDVARLDALLNRQVNAILHHPRFQKLEASWRGVRYLLDQVEEGANIKVRILNLSWKDLSRDVDRALEFDQSQLFRKVYEDEFGTPGGEPFGVLIGDYEIHPRPSADHPLDDVATLGKVAGVAAAAFAPFLTAAHPSLLDMTSFTELERVPNLSRALEHPDYLKWWALRDAEDARFVGLTLPRVLMRVPYTDDNNRVDAFRFCEDVSAPDRSQYLWGNAAYAFAGVLMRAFAESGWLASIRGVPPEGRGGGLVTGLPMHSFTTDRSGVAPKCSTEVEINDFQEKELADIGLIPLSHCPDTPLAAFHGNQSLQRPKKYDEPAATANARLSGMLQYMFCVSRVAHYLKVMGRDKMGAFASPEECEGFLNRWLMKYVADQDGGELQARYPLRQGRVQVKPHPSKPGCYMCVAHLRPHFQLDQISTALRVATELAPARIS